jgi:hypothetical protein
MASISRDSQAVWPFAVRHVGSRWFITFPDRIPKIRCKTIPNASRSFPSTKLKNSPACDLLHKGLRHPALNHQNGSENRSIIANSTFGRPYRLCRDRHGHRRCAPCARLSHPDLTAFFGRTPTHKHWVSIALSKVHPNPEVFEASPAPAATNRVKRSHNTPG